MDEKDAELGFPGMSQPPGAESPPGWFVGWQPGKAPSPGEHGISWPLEKNTDLVLQTHLQPTGKAEPVQCAVGFYFTDEPPSENLFKIDLVSFAIDIPAGETNYTVSDSYVLPVEVDVLAVLPHAHYLGKEVRGFATLPDGSRKWLLWIKRWDFNWQGDYRFTHPVTVPKAAGSPWSGSSTALPTTFTTPPTPPRRVSYGVQTTDEMAGCGSTQVAPKQIWPPSPRMQNGKRTRHYRVQPLPSATDPKDIERTIIWAGSALHRSARRGREHFRAVALEPSLDEAHYNLALLLRYTKHLGEARREFETVLRLNPEHYKAHGNLGFICAELGDRKDAELHFRAALAINADDELCRSALDELLRTTSKSNETR
jgi:hypothetical protein